MLHINTLMCYLVVFICYNGKHVISKRLEGTQRVVTIESEPYLMRKGDGEYEGYLVDLMDKVAEIMGFEYEFYLVEDGKYGSRQDDGHWNGIVGDLKKEKADIAAAPLTMSSLRRRVIHFSKPFMSLGITTLFTKTMKTPSPGTHMWLFRPFTSEVWCVIVVVMAICMLLLYLLNRFSPMKAKDETSESGGCARETHSLCSAIARILGVKDNQPVSVTIFFITWEVFVVLTGALYFSTLMSITAELESSVAPPYTSFDELEASNLDFGYIADGSTDTFFGTSHTSVYKRIYNHVLSNPSLQVKTTEEGIERVKAGNYVLIGESPTLGYAANTNCDLHTVGSLINFSTYGLAVPLGSENIVMRINLALQGLRENGILQKLEKKWWNDRSRCGSDTSYTGSSDSDSSDPHKPAGQITLDKFGKYGSMILLVIGLVLTLVVAAVEKLFSQK